MKMTLVILSLMISGSAFAKDLNCTGAGTYRGKEATTTVILNKIDGFVISDRTNDGKSSSSSMGPYNKVDFWNEAGVQALGYAKGIRIYLLNETEATMYREEGWGTSEPNGAYTHLTCK